MPTPIIVVASIVAVIVFLLMLRVKVCASYSDDFDYAVKYLFFTFRMKKQKKGQAKQEKPKPQKFTFEQLRQFLDIFERFWDDMKATLVKVKKKVRIDVIKIDLTIGSDDAAQTAITYGGACAVIFPAVSAFEMIVKVRKKQISIKADFNGVVNINFDCRASMRLSSILAIGIVSTVKIVVSLIKNPIHIGQRGA